MDNHVSFAQVFEALHVFLALGLVVRFWRGGPYRARYLRCLGWPALVTVPVALFLVGAVEASGELSYPHGPPVWPGRVVAAGMGWACAAVFAVTFTKPDDPPGKDLPTAGSRWAERREERDHATGHGIQSGQDEVSESMES
jgi:hypothetical protein